MTASRSLLPPNLHSSSFHVQNTVIKNLYCSLLHFASVVALTKRGLVCRKHLIQPQRRPARRKHRLLFMAFHFSKKPLLGLYVHPVRQTPRYRAKRTPRAPYKTLDQRACKHSVRTRAERLHAPLLRHFPSASFTAKKANFVPHTLFPLLSLIPRCLHNGAQQCTGILPVTNGTVSQHANQTGSASRQHQNGGQASFCIHQMAQLISHKAY